MKPRLRSVLSLITFFMFVSSLMCMCTLPVGDDLPPVVEDGPEGTETADALETYAATAFASEPSGTNAAASSTLETTLTPLPTLKVLFTLGDPEGDAASCATTDAADDPAVDIIRAEIAEPRQNGSSTHDGSILAVYLKQEPGQTVASDWSFAISIMAILAGGQSTNFLYEMHDGILRAGHEDESHNVIAGTESSAIVSPDRMTIQFLLPKETQEVQIFSFHTRSEDAPDIYNCDMLPNQGTLALPNGQ